MQELYKLKYKTVRGRSSGETGEKWNYFRNAVMRCASNVCGMFRAAGGYGRVRVGERRVQRDGGGNEHFLGMIREVNH